MKKKEVPFDPTSYTGPMTKELVLDAAKNYCSAKVSAVSLYSEVLRRNQMPKRSATKDDVRFIQSVMSEAKYKQVVHGFSTLYVLKDLS